jgi:hypothetical protein
MANCQYCGGQLGVDCFNQSDCGWITQQQDAEIAAHEVAQVGQHEREQIEAQLDAANAEIARLRAELAEAREDSERLDAAQQAGWTIGPLDAIKPRGAWTVVVLTAAPTSRHYYGQTARAAIDAARKGESNG